MRIKIVPNTSRNGEIYAIKDQATGHYLWTAWHSKDRTKCLDYLVQDNISRLANERDLALKRFDSVLEILELHANKAKSLQTSGWKDKRLVQIERWLRGDLVLVKIEFSLNSKEYPA